MKRLAIFVFALSICTVALAQGIKFEHKSWDKVKKQAAKEDKFIFVDAYTTWCGPCKWMSANVFTEESVGDFYNANFINVKIDMEEGEGLDFAKEYNVVAYPTLLFIDSEGAIVHKRLGAVPAPEFVNFGKDALDPEKRIGTLIEEYQAGNRDSEFLRTYVTRMTSAGMDPMEAADLYFASLSDDDLVTKENFYLIRMMRPKMESEHFSRVLDNREEFATVAGEDEVNAFLKQTCNAALMNAIYKDDDEAFKALRDEVAAMNGDFAKEVVLYADMRQAWGEGEYSDFVKYADKYAKEYAWDNWNELNTIAWDIYEDDEYSGKEYLDLGLKLAKQSVKLDENYYNTDTYAALLYKSGDFKKAKEWAELALQHAASEKMEAKETEQLLDKIKAEML